MTLEILWIPGAVALGYVAFVFFSLAEFLEEQSERAVYPALAYLACFVLAGASGMAAGRGFGIDLLGPVNGFVAGFFTSMLLLVLSRGMKQAIADARNDLQKRKRKRKEKLAAKAVGRQLAT